MSIWLITVVVKTVSAKFELSATFLLQPGHTKHYAHTILTDGQTGQIE